jgi:hypothetical protein
MIYKADRGCYLCLPAGSEIPNWFSHQTTGSSISFHVPSSWGVEFSKLLLCVVFAANKEAPRDLSRVSNFSWTLRNKTRTHLTEIVIGSRAGCFFGSCEDQIFVQATPGLRMKSGDEIEVSVKIPNEELKGEIQVKKCGIHLPVNEPSVMYTSGERCFVSEEIPIFAGDVARTIPLDWANFIEVDESDFYTFPFAWP